MTFRRMLFRNLTFHWRAHVAVLLGVAVGAAVLAGALLVGDSLRGSLRERAEMQRAGVDAMLMRGGFFRAAPDVGNAQSGIILRGAIRAGDGENARRANNVTLMAGFDLSAFAGRGVAVLAPALPAALATMLNLNVGDEFVVRVPVPAAVPSESLLGQREEKQTSIELTLKLASILPDDHPASLFRLQPGFAAPRNVVVPLPVVQEALETFAPPLVVTENRRRKMLGHNAILAAGDVAAVEQSLKRRLGFADHSLKWGTSPFESPTRKPMMTRPEASRLFVPKVAESINVNGDPRISAEEIDSWYGTHGHLSIESHRGIIETPVAAALVDATRASGFRAAPTLVHVANEIRSGDKVIPYSVIAALEPNLEAPLGPFLPPGIDKLGDDEIVLIDWPESPLSGLPKGANIQLKFFQPELKDGRFVEDTATFRLAGYLPASGAALDPLLTPAFPGVTDKLRVSEWNPPFPYDNKRMQAVDEDYWRDYRTIPKAFVSLTTGRRLFASRYGDTTSIRIAPEKRPWAEVRSTVETRLASEPGDSATGFAFDDVKARFAIASRGGQDFGGLFLGFSFFLIASALLLVGLLTRLNLERRASEVGLLLAAGWRLRTVRTLLLLEITIVSALGGVLGLIAAVAYAGGMLRLLRELWPDAVAGSLLQLHVGPLSLAIGYIATLVMSLATTWWSLRWLGRVAPSGLLAGRTSESSLPSSKRGRFAVPILVTCFVVAIVALLIGGRIDNPQFRAMTFFAGGTLLLTASLMLAWRWLKREPQTTHLGRGLPALLRLASRNAGRNPARSLLTAGLLATAAFLLVAVESFRRRPDGDFASVNGGSGGCPLVIETSQPLFFDVNDDAASLKGKLKDIFQVHYQRRPKGEESPEATTTRDLERLRRANVYSFRRSAGDDASCLNLFQAGRPQVLGVPADLIRRGGFRFVQSEASTTEERENPWLLLDKPRDDGAIPVIAEQNSLMWMLKKGLGDEIELPDEASHVARLRVVGVIKDSVFQSELLASSADFVRLFPRTEGFTFHLIESPPDEVNEVEALLRVGLSPYEPEFTRSADRVAAFMAVENTYLTTFQLLGGLGLILGALGLAVVMLRGVWERRSELALLRALGYRQQALGTLVLSENAMLLGLGLLAGVGSALLSVLPHVVSGGSIPWLRLVALLGLVMIAGLSAGLLAIVSTLRAPLLPALRKE